MTLQPSLIHQNGAHYLDCVYLENTTFTRACLCHKTEEYVYVALLPRMQQSKRAL